MYALHKTRVIADVITCVLVFVCPWDRWHLWLKHGQAISILLSTERGCKMLRTGGVKLCNGCAMGTRLKPAELTVLRYFSGQIWGVARCACHRFKGPPCNAARGVEKSSGATRHRGTVGTWCWTGWLQSAHELETSCRMLTIVNDS